MHRARPRAIKGSPHQDINGLRLRPSALQVDIAGTLTKLMLGDSLRSDIASKGRAFRFNPSRTRSCLNGHTLSNLEPQSEKGLATSKRPKLNPTESSTEAKEPRLERCSEQGRSRGRTGRADPAGSEEATVTCNM